MVDHLYVFQRRCRRHGRDHLYVFRRPWHGRRRRHVEQPDILLFLLQLILVIPVCIVLLLLKVLTVPVGFIANHWSIKDEITIDSTLLPCIFTILIHCGVFGALLICLLVMNEDEVTDTYYQYYNYFSSNTEMRVVVQNLATQAYVKCLDEARAFINNLSECMTGIYNYTLRFLDISWQVLNLVRNYATYIGGWLLGNILHFVTLLDAHFPGGILGIAILLFVVIVIMLVGRIKILSIAYTRCMEDQQKLQLKLEDTELRLQAKTKKLKQESDELKSNLEKDKRLCGICQDKIKTILLLPCQHMCLCKQYLDRKKWKKCPICRQRVESIMEIYV